MVSKVPNAYWPKGSTPAWKYLSFDKFVNFLIHREIVFTRASLFTDQNELRLLSPPKDSERSLQPLTREQAKKIEKRVDHLRNTTFISCWSLGRSESYPFWKIYLGGSRNGVAIRSTVERLTECLSKSSRQIYSAGVAYSKSAFEEDPPDEKLICTKLEPYSFEREFRLFIRYNHRLESPSSDEFTPNILSESVNLQQLLKQIYISPFSSSWFEKTVRDTIEKIVPDLNVPIRRSQVRD